MFHEHLVLSLTKDWINIFGKLPTFTVFLDNKKRLILQSEPCSIKEIRHPGD